MATSVTKAFCRAHPCPLSLSLSHTDTHSTQFHTHAVPFSFTYTNSQTAPSLLLSLGVCLYPQSPYFPLFCFSSPLSLDFLLRLICFHQQYASVTTPLFLTLSCSHFLLFPSLNILSCRHMFYSHFPIAPTFFFFLFPCLLFCPQFPLSFLPLSR